MNIGKPIKTHTDVPRPDERAIPVKDWPAKKEGQPIPAENWPARVKVPVQR